MQNPILIIAVVVIVLILLGIGLVLLLIPGKPKTKSTRPGQTQRPGGQPEKGSKKSVCPYCSAPIEAFSGEQEKCPTCGKTFWVQNGELLTEEEFQTRMGLKELAPFHITREMFIENQRDFASRYGYAATANETVWRILTEVAQKDYASGAAAYASMARIADREVRDFGSYLLSAYRNKLLDLQNKGVQRVVVVHAINAHEASAECCAPCKALHGQVFEIDRALRELPLPRQCTSYHVCTCDYVSEEAWQRAGYRGSGAAGSRKI